MKGRYVAILLYLLTCTVVTEIKAQVNAYAKVTGISGRVFTLSNVSEVYHTFEDGEKIVIMQMQDDVNGDATNNSTFGSLGSIKSAGVYEVLTIASHTESAGVPGTVTVSTNLSNTYNIGSNSSVQIISFRKYGSLDYTTVANMTALDWNGTIGGVLAMEVTGTLTLAHNLTANAAGFRGGARSGVGNSQICDVSTWITSNNAASGQKGEGIYKITSNGQVYGRAKVLNGGGGGNLHNAGGAGGGNYTSGGDGGAGYLCSSTPAGGQGGISLNTSISSSRIFMGGGGGGGQQNNSVGTAGADGGGIILVKANQIVTAGSCGTITIAANGGTAANSTGNDACGGGGAGGSIVFQVNTFSIASGCTLSVSANGGNGGSVNDTQTHGGGGGGGQGVVIYTSAKPTNNVTTSTENGTGGCDQSNCTTHASTAAGTTNTGITSNAGNTPLPVSLLYFKGSYNDQLHAVDLRWATASELNNDYFTLERSLNGENFIAIDTVKGNGTSSSVFRYQYTDTNIKTGVYYYRLSQTDLDGTTVSLGVIRVELLAPREPYIAIYPNPTDSKQDVTIDLIDVPDGLYTIAILDMQGVEVTKTQANVLQSIGTSVMSLNSILNGIYVVRITAPGYTVNKKLLIR